MRVLIISCLVMCFNGLLAQSENYTLFKEAITQLHNEHQKNKAEKLASFEKAKANVEAMEEEKPSVTVMGGTTEQNAALEEAVEGILKGEKPNKNPQKKKEKSYIEFKQVHMVPGKGEAMQPMFSFKREDQKIEWVSSETITTTETIYIEDISDPKEKERMQKMSDAYGARYDLIETNFIEALYTETQTESQYNTMIKDLEDNGYSMKDAFKKIKVLDKGEKLEFMKSSIMKIVDQVTAKQ